MVREYEEPQATRTLSKRSPEFCQRRAVAQIELGNVDAGDVGRHVRCAEREGLESLRSIRARTCTDPAFDHFAHKKRRGIPRLVA